MADTTTTSWTDWLLPALLGLGGTALSTGVAANQASDINKANQEAYDKYLSLLKPSDAEMQAMRENALGRINQDYLAASRNLTRNLASRGLGGGAVAGSLADLSREQAATKGQAETAIELWRAGRTPLPPPADYSPSWGSLLGGQLGETAATLGGDWLDNLLEDYGKDALESAVDTAAGGVTDWVSSLLGGGTSAAGTAIANALSAGTGAYGSEGALGLLSASELAGSGAGAATGLSALLSELGYEGGVAGYGGQGLFDTALSSIYFGEGPAGAGAFDIVAGASPWEAEAAGLGGLMGTGAAPGGMSVGGYGAAAGYASPWEAEAAASALPEVAAASPWAAGAQWAALPLAIGLPIAGGQSAAYWAGQGLASLPGMGGASRTLEEHILTDLSSRNYEDATGYMQNFNQIAAITDPVERYKAMQTSQQAGMDIGPLKALYYGYLAWASTQGIPQDQAKSYAINDLMNGSAWDGYSTTEIGQSALGKQILAQLATFREGESAAQPTITAMAAANPYAPIDYSLYEVQPEKTVDQLVDEILAGNPNAIIDYSILGGLGTGDITW